MEALVSPISIFIGLAAILGAVALVSRSSSPVGSQPLISSNPVSTNPVSVKEMAPKPPMVNPELISLKSQRDELIAKRKQAQIFVDERERIRRKLGPLALDRSSADLINKGGLSFEAAYNNLVRRGKSGSARRVAAIARVKSSEPFVLGNAAAFYLRQTKDDLENLNTRIGELSV